jgi:hypothetical protein
MDCPIRPLIDNGSLIDSTPTTHDRNRCLSLEGSAKAGDA